MTVTSLRTAPQAGGARVVRLPDTPPVPEFAALPGPDMRLATIDANGDEVARCALWWRNLPPAPGPRVGVIGGYEAASAEAAGRLLDEACAVLRRHGCRKAVGPMDGDTWRPYRLVTEPGDRPPFFMEPADHSSWPGHFRAAGFHEFDTWVSTVLHDLAFEDPRLARAAAFCRDIAIRTLDTRQFDDELKRLHRVTLAAFAGHAFFRPIDSATFRGLYAPLRTLVREELVLVAERSGDPVGFLFALPDRTITDTVVLKTIAVAPARAHAGLGIVMANRLYRHARDLGYARAIHALMRVGHTSANTVLRYTDPIRRYALYARDLA